MTYSQIANIFARTYNGAKNIMTPSVVTYGKRGNLIYEISTGRGIRDEPIYGVTVLTVTGERVPAKSDLFSTRAAAERHARNLNA